MKSFIQILIVLLTLGLQAQTFYVSQESGSDSNNGLSESAPFETINRVLDVVGPGDTVLLMGTFTNASYNENYSFSGNIDDPYIWTQENTIRINNLNGTPSNYITFKAYDDNTVLKGDGANIIRVTNSSYLTIEGFEIQGIVENISLETALALQFVYREDGTPPSLYRVQPGTPPSEVEGMTFPILNNIKRPSYTDTRGIYFSNVHHINFYNNTVHHTPGNGFRVQGCDYINIIGNEVHNCSRKSYSGTHGLVVTNATNVDNSNAHKIIIAQNEVHHNFNEIYSWAPSKTIITPRIDEGKGISLQRNDPANGWNAGRILVENNLTYWNGFSGLHSNTGHRIDFINNTAYFNSYTNTVTYANEEQNGKNIGLSAQGGVDNKFINNISFIDADWGGFPISIANESNTEIRNNVVFGVNGNLLQDADVTAIAVNTIVANPLFEDAENLDFRILGDSPAIGEANTSFAPVDDFFENTRDANPDIGAIEFLPLSVQSFEDEKLAVFPNPFSDFINIDSLEPVVNATLTSVSGKKIDVVVLNNQIDTTQLPSGFYILQIGENNFKIVKK